VAEQQGIGGRWILQVDRRDAPAVARGQFQDAVVVTIPGGMRLEDHRLRQQQSEQE
jgi:hypothetical protein